MPVDPGDRPDSMGSTQHLHDGRTVKFQVNRDVFSEAVSFAVKLLPQRTTLPILSGVLIQASGDGLVLSSFDYEVSSRTEIQADVEEPGTVLAGAARGVGLDAQRDEIGRLVVGNSLHAIVIEADVDIPRCQAGDRRRRQRFHLPRTEVALSLAAADARMDEREPHDAARSDAGRAAPRRLSRPMIQSQL